MENKEENLSVFVKEFNFLIKEPETKRKELSDLIKEIEFLKKQKLELQNLSSHIESLKSKRKELDDENHEINKRKISLERDIAPLHKEVTSLKESFLIESKNYNSLKKEIENLEKKKMNSIDSIDSISSKYNVLQGQYNSKMSEHSSLQVELNGLSYKVRKTREEYNSILLLLESSKKEQEELGNTIKTYHKEKSNLEQVIADMKDSVVAAQEKKRKIVEQGESEIERISKEMQEKKNCLTGEYDQIQKEKQKLLDYEKMLVSKSLFLKEVKKKLELYQEKPIDIVI